MEIGETENVFEEMAGISFSGKQNENVMKGHGFERTMEGDCWCQEEKLKVL